MAESKRSDKVQARASEAIKIADLGSNHQVCVAPAERRIGMSATYRDMSCGSAQGFDALSDGWLLGLWVVGASRNP